MNDSDSELREWQLCNVLSTLKGDMKLAADMTSCMKCFSHVEQGKTFCMANYGWGILCCDIGYKRLTERMSQGQSYDVTDWINFH